MDSKFDEMQLNSPLCFEAGGSQRSLCTCSPVLWMCVCLRTADASEWQTTERSVNTLDARAGIDALGPPNLKVLDTIEDEHDSSEEFTAWNDGKERETT